MKNATLKLCVTPLLALTILFMVGQTVCYAGEQAPAAVEVSNTEYIVEETNELETITLDKSENITGPSSDTTLKKKETASGPALEITDTLVEIVSESTEITTTSAQPATTEPIETIETNEEKSVHNNRWDINPTRQEYEYLARITKLESGGESNIGEQAVIECILNRVRHSSFPNSITGVLSQRGQFTTWKAVNSRKATPTQKEYSNLNAVLYGKTNVIPMNTVFFSKGAQNKRVQARIGGHVFCNR